MSLCVPSERRQDAPQFRVFLLKSTFVKCRVPVWLRVLSTLKISFSSLMVCLHGLGFREARYEQLLKLARSPKPPLID